MDYTQALTKLHSLYKFGMQPGLERIRELLRRLGDPQLFRGARYIHVAGTNGKGSTAAMLANILCAAGFRVGFFSSPHLHHHCERYRINGQNMPEEAFAAIFSQVDAAIDSMLADGLDSPTEFEAATAVALCYFARERVDFAVLEAGMGGRLDSTNVVDAELAIITNVGFDHMNILGDTIAAIAGEKAGVIKPGSRVVTAAEGEALRVIEQAAEAAPAALFTLGRDFFFQPVAVDMTGSCFTVRTKKTSYKELCLPLPGRHQMANAALAVLAAELLGVDGREIAAGLRGVCWPGRLEVISRVPLYVIDGAHNEPGMKALAAAVREYWPGRSICCLLGMLADKQREQALSHLLPLLSEAVVTPPPLAERAGDWRRLAAICRSSGVPTRLAKDNREALYLAKSQVDQGYADMLLVTGSLYLLSDIRALLLEEHQPETP